MNDDNTFRTVDETICLQFESGWARGNPQPIEELVGQPTSENYLATLEELVHIELEFRWKDRNPLKRPQLEDYLKRFELLGESAILSRLVNQEIKLRLALGETPTSAEYQERFPETTVEIPAIDQGAHDTGVKSEDDVDTQREMPTMAPESDPDSTPGSDPLDSATLAGPEQQAKRKIILETDFVPGYDLLGELGRGGMGVVYQARDQKLKRIVALKMILSGVHASEEDMQRFQTEAEAVAKLQHPNIVQIFEVGEHKGNPYISLEYQEGGGLDKKIAGTPQNVEESAQLIETLAQAMQVAHQQDIIHRDLKPANILLSADGEPKITDFGLAKRMDEDSNQTKSGAVMGTPSYMAPEQAASSNETIGPAADTYALGAILYHLLTGRPPFRAETQLDTLMQVISDEPLPPRRLNSKVPADLETICLKCLQKDIDRRYVNSEELAEDLRRFQAGEPIAARPVSAIERSWKWARRRPAIAGMIGVSIVAAAALVAGGLVYNGKLVDERNVANSQRHQAEAAQEEAESQTKIAQKQTAKAEKNAEMAREAVDKFSALVMGEDVGETVRSEAKTLRKDFQKQFARDDPNKQKQLAAELIKNTWSMTNFLVSGKIKTQKLERAAELLESLHEEFPDQGQHLYGLAETYFRLALANIAVPEGKEVSRYHKKAIDAFQALIDLDPNSFIRGRLCIARQNMAVSYKLLGQHDQSLKVYRETRPTAEKLVEEDPSDYQAIFVLAQNHAGVGLVYKAQNGTKDQQAIEAIAKGIDLLKQILSTHPKDLQTLIVHAQLLNELAVLQAGTGKSSEAIESYLDAAENYRVLVSVDPTNIGFKNSLMVTLAHLSDQQWFSNKAEDSYVSLRDAIKVLQSLDEQNPDNEAWLQKAAFLFTALHDRQSVLAEVQESFLSLQQAHEARHRLAQRFPDKPELSDLEGKTLLALSKHRAQKTPAQKDASLQKAINFYRDLVRNHPKQLSYQLGYVASLTELTTRQTSAEKLEESLTTANTALRIVAALEPAEREQAKESLYALHDQCFNINRSLNRSFEALFHIWRQLEYDAPSKALDVVSKLRAKARENIALDLTAEDSTSYSDSLSIIEDMAEPEHSSAQCCFDTARIYAIIIKTVNNDTSLGETEQQARAAKFTARALHYLTAAQERGFFSDQKETKLLHNDKYFSAFRDREDFQQFITDVEAALEKK